VPRAAGQPVIHRTVDNLVLLFLLRMLKKSHKENGINGIITGWQAARGT
jgi:hypothetical protein